MVLERVGAGRQTPTAHGGAAAAPLSGPPSSYTCDRIWPGERSGHRQSAAPAGSVAPGSDRPGAFCASTDGAADSEGRCASALPDEWTCVLCSLPMDADHAVFAYAITGKPQLLDSTGYYPRYVY